MDSGWTAIRLCATAALALALLLLAAGTASAGLPDSATIVKDIKSGGPGTDSISPLSAPDFVVIGDTVYFVADDGTHGKELWRSDGTGPGTTIVKDIRDGSDGSDPMWLTNAGGTLFFSANDGTNGIELWSSDGSSGGTAMVEDIWTGAGSSSSPASITAMGGIAYFAASDPGGRKLWRSDGSEDGTRPVVSSGGPTGPVELTAINGTLYFVVNGGNDLWKTDGSEGGTELVKDVNAGPSGAGIEHLTPAGATIFFTFDGVSSNDRVLWTTDGTPDHTVVVPGQVAGFDPSNLAPLGSSVLFAGNGGGADTELWRSDGSGVERVEDISPTAQSLPNDLTNIGGIVYFLANDADGQEPWRSDGTAAGTFQLKNINPAGSSLAGRFTDFNGKVMFAASDDGFAANVELWRSDGTGTGTSQVGNINSSGSSSPNYLIKLGGKLLFGADDGSNGFELWRAVDTIAPQTAIDSGPAEGQTVADSTPAFGFSSDDNPATFECSVDGGAFVSCSSPNTLPVLGDGAHSFAVRASDAALNVDATPATRSFSVKAPALGGVGTADTQAPNAALSGKSAQKLGKTLAVTVSCPDEACAATAGGTVNRSKLGTATKSIAKGGTAKLQLKVAKKLARSIKKALRARKKVAANVQVVVADAAGNKRTLSKKIRIKP